MKAWRVIIAVFIVIAPLWVIAADQHLMHRMMFALAAMPVVLLAISLAQDDGAMDLREEVRTLTAQLDTAKVEVKNIEDRESAFEEQLRTALGDSILSKIVDAEIGMVPEDILRGIEALMVENNRLRAALKNGEEMYIAMRDRCARTEAALDKATGLSFLIPSFMEAMNDIGRYGFEKYGELSFQSRRLKGDTSRGLLKRTTPQAIADHATEHFSMYLNHIAHDHFGTDKHQLAAVAFNAMMEFYFAGLDEAPPPVPRSKA